MRNILQMEKGELLKLTVGDIPRLLTQKEFVHIARKLGAYWTYDYEAADKGKAGLHAELKSGLHSDGFFVSYILLEPENMLDIFAHQMVMRMKQARIPKPDFIAGIPDGATKLGKRIAELLHVPETHLVKENGRIVLKSEIPAGKSLLLVEDFCTRGTGFKEAVLEIKNRQPTVRFHHYELVILNRGGLKMIFVEGVSHFIITPLVEYKIQDWDPKKYCKLCVEYNSTVIPPKKTDENWRLLTTSQL